ncbi:MAG: putative DNA binding domain-containing protein [Thermodesulfobacteriota bacterium]|nr:putative DNA binding domain-containing protein [Thermodesulfobacteriota bacterium]
MNKRQTRRRLSMPQLRAILIPLAGFLVILMALNGYQYFKLKSNLAGPVISEISDAELRDMQHFFDSISDKLKIVRDWARNGVLDRDDIIGLNKKFMPLIKHQEQLSGILLADNKGREYYLRPDENSWVTRTRAAGQEGTLLYRRWQEPDKSIEQWQKKSDYSPEKRPWFHHSEKEDYIYWTPVYTFYEEKIKGISASVSWNIADTENDFAVFAIDIPIKELRQLLKANERTRRGILFLVNPYSDYFILGDGAESEKEDTPPAPISELISQWKQADQPARQIVRLQNNKQQWLATFKPMLKYNSVLWVGVAASEKELVAGLNSTLFDIDLIDLLVACAGGGAMLLLIWLNGGLRSSRSPEQEDPVLKVHSLINKGEGNNIEFKSTVRINLKNGKPGKEIEFAWLKAVIAFLNSDGGTLLIGIADDGRIHGLEPDNFENDDRCLLHIKNLFNQHVGAEFSDFADFTLVEIEDKKIVVVDCRPAGRPVFLKVGKNEEFFIRSGPSNSKLRPSQMIRYIQQKK